ncbi:uncharacterized protein LOC143449644 isoform X2 [Clavelina lepadiformis]|uniref:uncharacterized protein LOC143449644 isoform X2 n=1 Tax=Clavelina lepadiformis TaxID=159417 RepID=UPI004042E638
MKLEFSVIRLLKMRLQVCCIVLLTFISHGNALNTIPNIVEESTKSEEAFPGELNHHRFQDNYFDSRFVQPQHPTTDTKSCKLSIDKNCENDGRCSYSLKLPSIDISGTLANIMSPDVQSRTAAQQCQELSGHVREVSVKQTALAEQSTEMGTNLNQKIQKLESELSNQIFNVSKTITDMQKGVYRPNITFTDNIKNPEIHLSNQNKEAQVHYFKVIEQKLESLELLFKASKLKDAADVEIASAKITPGFLNFETVDKQEEVTLSPASGIHLRTEAIYLQKSSHPEESIQPTSEVKQPTEQIFKQMMRSQSDLNDRINRLEQNLANVIGGLEQKLLSSIKFGFDLLHGKSPEISGNVDKVLEKTTVYEDSTTSALDSDVISATPVESTAATTAVSTQSATLAASATAASSTVNITPTATTSEGGGSSEDIGPGLMLCRTCCEQVSLGEYLKAHGSRLPSSLDGSDDSDMMTRDPRFKPVSNATGDNYDDSEYDTEAETDEAEEVISIIRGVITNEYEQHSTKKEKLATQIENTPLNETVNAEMIMVTADKKSNILTSVDNMINNDDQVDNVTWEMTVVPRMTSVFPTVTFDEITLPSSDITGVETVTKVTLEAIDIGSGETNNSDSSSIVIKSDKKKGSDYIESSGAGSVSENSFSHNKTLASPVLTTSQPQKMEESLTTIEADDCAELYLQGKRNSGTYTISPRKRGKWRVFCDMDTDGGGWTVIQRRYNGMVNFTRNWADYKNGFGKPDGEYWLGLDRMHFLTTTKKTRRLSLRIDLTDWDGVAHYAQYDVFRVRSESRKYQLIARKYSGTAGDALNHGDSYNHNMQFFTTYDRDNDHYKAGNCGEYYQSGWWFNACFAANLNGQYHRGPYKGVQKAIYWGTWYKLSNPLRNLRYTFKKVDMKVRPVRYKAKRRM